MSAASGSISVEQVRRRIQMMDASDVHELTIERESEGLRPTCASQHRSSVVRPIWRQKQQKAPLRMLMGTRPLASRGRSFLIRCKR